MGVCVREDAGACGFRLTRTFLPGRIDEGLRGNGDRGGHRNRKNEGGYDKGFHV
jgi:hypothetical protein